jgi:hypothetical protein
VGKRPLGSPRRRWMHNIKMDLRDVVWSGMDWIFLAQDRDGNMVMNLRVPRYAGTFLSSCTTGWPSRIY